MNIENVKTPIKVAALVFALGVVAAAMFGCSVEAPFAPTLEQEGLKAIAAVESQFGDDPLAAAPDSGVNQESSLGKKVVYWYASDQDLVTVDVDGGTIYLDLGGNVSELEIPEDAVCENDETGDCQVQIGARAVSFATPYGPVVFYDFGPDGLQFAAPAILKLSTGFKQGVVLWLFWLNPETGGWEVEQRGAVDKDGVVEFEVHHFSKYAIS